MLDSNENDMAVESTIVGDTISSLLPFLNGFPQEATQEIFDDLFEEEDFDQGEQQDVDNVTLPKSRNTYERMPKEESNFYRRYLASETIKANASNPDHPKGKEFRSLFGVPFDVFELLVNLTLEKGWYNPERRDAGGRKCHDIRLLILGCLCTMASNATSVANQSNTNISCKCHSVFHTFWVSKMSEIKDEFIKMPTDQESLENAASEFENSCNLVGCVGSMDVVKIGWNKCPSSLVP